MEKINRNLIYVKKYYLKRRVTAPATTGEATLVPDSDLHPLL